MREKKISYCFEQNWLPMLVFTAQNAKLLKSLQMRNKKEVLNRFLRTITRFIYEVRTSFIITIIKLEIHYKIDFISLDSRFTRYLFFIVMAT